VAEFTEDTKALEDVYFAQVTSQKKPGPQT
jgi:hypothetical protein